METIGDFKKAGLVFVSGDACKDVDSGHEYTANGWGAFTNDGDKDWLDDCATSFAWRENTGEKPSFSGWVDVITKIDAYNGVSEYEVKKSSDVDWRIHCCSHQVVKWRPTLDQPEQNTSNNEAAKPNDKPIFTQEMADGNELPPVGSYAEIAESTEYLSIRYEAGAKVKVYATFTDDRGAKLAAFVDDNGKVGGVATAECFKPIDTRTPKQKAVDEMIEHDLWATDKEFCEALYDAGYRKVYSPKESK